ncbi:MAG: carboxypeptidase-like regulatory domain-containing protein [Pirellulaceae bacterium]
MMNRARKTCWMALCLAMLNGTLPLSHLCGGEPSAPATRAKSARVVDVALGTGGELRGRVLDVQGRPAIASHIAVLQEGQPIATVASDRQGAFLLRGLHGGLFHVTSGNHLYICRGWAPGTAPPAASDQLLVVEGGVVERGQRPISDLFLSDPVMIGLIVAAAIAIPIAVSNSKSGRRSGS